MADGPGSLIHAADDMLDLFKRLGGDCTEHCPAAASPICRKTGKPIGGWSCRETLARYYLEQAGEWREE